MYGLEQDFLFSHIVVTPSRVFPASELAFEASNETPEKVINGSFEDGTTGWSFPDNSGSPHCQPPFTITTAQAHLGTHSAQYTSSTGNGNSVTQVIPVVPGRRYELRFRVFVQTPSNRMALVTLTDGVSPLSRDNNDAQTTFYLKPSTYTPVYPTLGVPLYGDAADAEPTYTTVTTIDGWEELFCQFTPKQGVSTVRFTFHVGSADPANPHIRCASVAGGGTWYIDNVSVTPVALDADESILAAAIYTGVVLKFDANRLELSGPGMAYWLGDDEGKGQIYETAVNIEDGTFDDWMQSLIGPVTSVRLGNVTEPPGGKLYTRVFAFNTPRDAISNVCTYFRTEWRIRPNGIVDAGPPSALFQTEPRCVFTRRGGLPEVNLRSVKSTNLSKSLNGEKYATKATVLTSAFGIENVLTGSATRSDHDMDTLDGGITTAAPPYKDLYGNDVEIVVPVSDPGSEVLQANEVARAHLQQEFVLEELLEADTGSLDIGMPLEPGDWVYVYDPTLDIIDTDNEVVFQGQVIYPVKKRVYARTRPVRANMGVYLRRWDGVFVDLSPWVVDEGDQGTSIEQAPEIPLRLPMNLQDLLDMNWGQ